MNEEKLNDLLIKTITALKEAEDALLLNKIQSLKLETELIKLREALPQWISVKDGLPDIEGEEYLVIRVGNFGKRVPCIMRWCGEEEWAFESVTDWMPIPSLPSTISFPME